MNTADTIDCDTLIFGGVVRAVEKATITRTHLGFEGHSFMTVYFGLRFPGATQSRGGLNLTTPELLSGVVRRTLAVTGVSTWEEVAGRPVRAVHSTKSDISQVIALLHPTDDSIVLTYPQFERATVSYG